jgi:hypothetical protein
MSSICGRFSSYFGISNRLTKLKSVSPLIVSKAILKSIKHAYTFFDDLMALLLIILRVKM